MTKLKSTEILTQYPNKDPYASQFFDLSNSQWDGSADTEAVAESTGYGILQAGYMVSQYSTPNMSVQIAPGTVHMPDGKRFTLADPVVLPITTADPTNPRIDLIYVSSAGAISYLAGNPAQNPVAPAVPNGGLGIANINVATGATSIINGNIIDKRKIKPNYSNSGSINVKDFGAVGDGIVDDTAAIQAAINYAAAIGKDYARFALKSSPLGNAAIGYEPRINIPHGTYLLSDALTFSNYTKICSNNAILLQSNSAKNIFTSTNIYQNEFDGITFIGSTTQIFAQNGATGVYGLEGCLVKIKNCEFNGSASFAVRILPSGSGGGAQAMISSSRFFNFAQAIESEVDECSVRDCWFESDNTCNPANTAWIKSAIMKMTDCCFVPAGDYSAANNTNRYFDNYGNLTIDRCRFGAEGAGGMPITYNFTNALANLPTYPYEIGGSIIIKDCDVAITGNSIRNDHAYIVLKSGIPKQINIEDNFYGSSSPFIRTNLLSSGSDFATYFATASGISQPGLHLRIRNNSGWALSLTDSTTSTNLLKPWTEYEDFDPVNGPTINFNKANFNTATAVSLTSNQFVLPNLAQTTTSGTTSVVDTGIYPLGSGGAKVYSLVVTANSRSSGSALYGGAYIGNIIVYCKYYSGNIYAYIEYVPIASRDGGADPDALSISAVFWNGTTESSSADPTVATNQIRIKISGYVGTVGQNQRVKIQQIS